jgi:hypothetical protein
VESQTPAPDAVESDLHGAAPKPVTPSEGTERPDGVAFDLPAGTETPGMPRGDQRAVNDDEAQTVRESVKVPPGQLDLPGTDGAA